MAFRRKVLLSLGALLFGCSQGVDPIATTSSSNLSGTFVVDVVSGAAQEAETEGSFSNIATARLFSFKACLKDAGALQPITGASFRVMAQDKALPLKSPTPDQNGCLFWTERIDFQATNAETFFTLEREIEAVSVHRGKVQIPIAVNPWRTGGESVRDLRFESAPKTVDSSLRSQNSEGENPLALEQVGVELELSRSERSVASGTLKVRFEPKLKRKGIDGRVILEPIHSGRFSVRVQILAVGPHETKVISRPAPLSDSYFREGAAWAEGKVEILQRIPREFLLEMAFEATPTDGPKSFRPLRGRVPLGRLSSLSLKTSSQLRLDASAFPGEGDSIAGKGEGSVGFLVGEVKARNVTVSALDSTGRPKRIELEFFGCFKNAISQDPILEQRFLLRMRSKETSVTTNAETGCAFWRDTFEFDFYGRDSYLPLPLEIISQSPFYGGQSLQKQLYVNFQNYESPGDMVLDRDFHGTPAPALADTESSAELTLANTGFNFLGRDFSIDSLLNLSTTRRYRFELRPEIRRLSRDKGWLPPLGSGNGKYRLKVLLETLGDSRPMVLDAKELTVESINNVIMGTVDLTFRDLRQVGPRVQLTLQVLPLESDSSLRSLPYGGVFDPIRGFIVRLSPRSIDLLERFSTFASQERTRTIDSVKIFANDRKHILVEKEMCDQMGIQSSEVQEFFRGNSKPLLKRFCSQFFDPKGWWSPHRSCLVNPESYMNYAHTEHLKEVRSAQISRPAETSTLSMSAGVNVVRSESEDESQASTRSFAVDAGARLSVPILKQLGLDFGLGVGMQQSWSTSKSYSKSKSKGQNRSADLGKQITVDQISFRIEGETKNCALITSLIPRPQDRKTYMVCSQENQRRSMDETYFFLYQAINDSAALDGGASLAERPFVALIRGQNRFDAFARVLKDPESTLRIDRSLPAPQELMEAYQNRFDGLFPGLLTPKE